MKQWKVVICDEEEEFSLGLMDYINRDEKSPYMAVAFSRPDKCALYLADHRIHCLMANRMFQRELQTEAPVLWLSGSKAEKDTIYKYQSMEAIRISLDQIVTERGAVTMTDTGMSVYGVYSPIGRSGKTSFALALCSHLNRRGRSLYLGFEEYSSFLEGQSEMSDLLYLIRSHSPDLGVQLENRLRTKGQVDFLPSPAAYMDIRQLTLEDMTWFLEQLRQNSRYTALVFDIGAGSFADIGILQLMNRIFMPVLSDGGQEKERNFRQMLNDMQLSYLNDRLVPVRLEEACRSGEIMERLLTELVG